MSCLSASLFAAPSADAGKTLFTTNCASCHAKDMKTKLTGPALAGVEQAWAEFPREDLYSWIRNSQALIAKGHPRAVKIWAEYKPTVMTSFTALKDEEIESILMYIQVAANPPAAAGAVATNSACAPLEESKNTNIWLYITIAAILGILVLVMSRIIANLNHMTAVMDGETPPVSKTFREIMTGRNVVSFAIFALVVLGGYTTVNRAVALGRQQGYQPDQPIKFSHATHACENQIDCNYCHDGARRSKQSIIPAANTCMNCHKAIKTGSVYGTAEISKIFASNGFNPNTGTYIENYDKLSDKEIEKIFKQWIGDQAKAANATISPQELENRKSNEWQGIVASLTNENKKKIQGPIEWVRIHNLPDHVYFNHAQHVTVGKVACEKCHGDVKKMDVVKQYSPLSMGWCINCHRQTEIQFKDNAYYETGKEGMKDSSYYQGEKDIYQMYKRYHDEIKNGKREKVTVEDIGGLECQKCHY